MSKEKLEQLKELLEELQQERLDELNEEFKEGVYSESLKEDVNVYRLAEEDPTTLYELDDGDCLSEGIDTVLNVVLTKLEEVK